MENAQAQLQLMQQTLKRRAGAINDRQSARDFFERGLSAISVIEAGPAEYTAALGQIIQLLGTAIQVTWKHVDAGLLTNAHFDVLQSAVRGLARQRRFEDLMPLLEALLADLRPVSSLRGARSESAPRLDGTPSQLDQGTAVGELGTLVRGTGSDSQLCATAQAVSSSPRPPDDMAWLEVQALLAGRLQGPSMFRGPAVRCDESSADDGSRRHSLPKSPAASDVPQVPQPKSFLEALGKSRRLKARVLRAHSAQEAAQRLAELEHAAGGADVLKRRLETAQQVALSKESRRRSRASGRSWAFLRRKDTKRAADAAQDAKAAGYWLDAIQKKETSAK